MKILLHLILLFSFMIATGCQIANSKAPPTKAATGPIHTVMQCGSLVPSVTITQEGKILDLHFSIINDSKKPITLQFNTTQTFDYSLTQESKGEIARYSKGKMFGQIVSTLRVQQGEALNYSSTLSGIKPGHYQLTVWLTDQACRPKLSVPLTVD